MKNVIVGRQPVLEALKAGQPIEKILIQHGSQGGAISSIYKMAKKSGIPIAEASKDRFRELGHATAPQGVLALVGTTRYVELEDILGIARQRNEPPFILILDEIEDPHNLGALIRTAEGAGAHGVIIPKHHSAVINEIVTKASAGAVAHLGIARVTNISQVLDELKHEGVWITGTDDAGEKAFYELDYSGPVAVVIGNEGRGMRRLVREKCDFIAKIPMYGKMDSLNASVAGGLMLFEVAKQRHGREIRQDKGSGAERP